jgi:phosphoribosylformimino-5-aminoimidazole carboxamide ribonucleotide (ProFAR) isomerase
MAGGSVDLDAIKGLRDAGIAGIILGEPLLSGALDFAKALEAAA